MTTEEPIIDQFQGERALDYDRRTRIAIPGYVALHDCVGTILREELSSTAHVLVAGIGTGEEVVRLGPLNPGWRFTGFDPSADMLAIAQRRIADANVENRVDLIHGRVDDLPPADTFAAATMLLVTHFLPDDGTKLDLLRGVARRLRPDAPLLLADLHGDPRSEAFARLMAVWRRRVLDSGADPNVVSESFARIHDDIAFVSEARIADLLTDAGFTEPIPFWRGLLFGAWLAYRVPRYP